MNTKTPISFINTAAYLFLGIASMSPLAPRAAAQKTPTAPQDVRVVNTAAEPVPMTIDANTNTVKLDGTTNTVNSSAQVPDGKRLIVEFVTVKITMPHGQSALFAKLDTSAFDQFLTLTAAGNDSVGNTLVIATHKVFVILAPGTIVQTSAFR